VKEKGNIYGKFNLKSEVNAKTGKKGEKGL
jgi:hypothetical protein